MAYESTGPIPAVVSSKLPKSRTLSAITGGLLQVKRTRANPNNAFSEQQVLCHGDINVKHLSNAYHRKEVDGFFGEATGIAIQRFQMDRNNEPSSYFERLY
jgi:hypothetical protein